MTYRGPLALLASAAATLAFAAPAHARVPDDPCTGLERSLTDLEPNLKRACYSVFDIPPHAQMYDENRIRHDGVQYCPQRWTIPNPKQSPPGPFWWGNWDYWTLRGEWVTWMGDAILGKVDANGFRMNYVLPQYKNWGSWSWPVRTFHECEPDWRSRARMAQDEPLDVVEPTPGDDVRAVGAADDQAFGGRGEDALAGGRGDDTLLGGRGADELIGGSGGDQLFDDQGEDTLRGGAGDDRFSTRDGDRDLVDCGGGEDIAIGDDQDRFADCEHVYRSAAEDPARPPEV